MVFLFSKSFLARYITSAALVIFFISYGYLIYSRPAFLFQKNGTVLRPFGIGYKNKTIFPLWLIACVLGIISYLIVLYYIKFG